MKRPISIVTRLSRVFSFVTHMSLMYVSFGSWLTCLLFMCWMCLLVRDSYVSHWCVFWFVTHVSLVRVSDVSSRSWLVCLSCMCLLVRDSCVSCSCVACVFSFVTCMFFMYVCVWQFFMYVCVKQENRRAVPARIPRQSSRHCHKSLSSMSLMSSFIRDSCVHHVCVLLVRD